MNSFDKYKLPKNTGNQNINTEINVFDKYRDPKNTVEEIYSLPENIEDEEEALIDKINRYAEEQENVVPINYESEGDDWLPYLGKKTISTISEIPDLAPNVLELGEMALRTPFQYADKTGDFIRKSFDIDLGYKEIPWFYKSPKLSNENIGRPSNRIKYYINKLGIPTEVQPKNAAQSIAGNAIEFATPSGFVGLLSKGNKIKNAAKGTLLGADIGLTSGTLQEAGVPPIVSDTLAIATNPLRNYTLNKGYNTIKDVIYDYVSPYGHAERKVNRLINNSNIIKRDELDKLIDYKPSGEIIPVTAEVAQDYGISNLHNSYAPTLTGITRKQRANDAIYRSKLDDIGTQSPLTAENIGSYTRDEILAQLNKLKGIRKSESEPFYAALETSKKLYPVKNFSHYNKKAIKGELGEAKKMLTKTKGILFAEVKDKIKSKQNRLTNLKQSLIADENSVRKKISNPSKETFKQTIPDYEKKQAVIAKLEKEIQKESNNFTANFIDKASTEIGNKILETRKSDRRGSKNIIRHLEEQKKALENDLLSTAEGAEARRTYATHSKPINEIEQDKIFNNFLKTDEFGNYKYSPEEALKKISNASNESARKYGRMLKDTEAGNANRRYLVDLFTEKTKPTQLPTAHKSRSHLKSYGKYHEGLMSTQEQQLFNEINEYLQNRATYASGNMTGVGSATAPRGTILKETERYLGKPHLKRIPKYLSTARPNESYTVLEEFLTDPMYAQKLLNQDPIKVMKLKPHYKDYLNYSIPSMAYLELKRRNE